MAKTTVNDTVTFKDLYTLVDDRTKETNKTIDRVEEKCDIVTQKVSNIEGRLMLVPFLISTGIGVFFFIIDFVLTNKK